MSKLKKSIEVTEEDVENTFIPQGAVFDILPKDAEISPCWVHCVMLSNYAPKGKEVIAYYLHTSVYTSNKKFRKFEENWQIGTLYGVRKMLLDYIKYLSKLMV